jgi:UTP--glucose-1-phosphate uridylyltransferase
MNLNKAVFPVAGIGSRFLPATKANPKEMLPIVDKPLIQYAVEEAVRAGFSHMIFITSSSKRAIEDHFDNHYELESRLHEQGKHELLEIVRNVSPPGIKFTYIRQNQPLGLGHAILCSEHIVGDNPFAVLLADDLIDESKHNCLTAMAQHFREHHDSLVAVQSVPLENVHQYGIVKIEPGHNNFSPILDVVEKPRPEEAPSRLAAVGRYIFTPEIFNHLKETSPDYRGEIQLTDGIQKLLKRKNVAAFTFNGKRYDCGSKLGYLQATIEIALKHNEIGKSFSNYLRAFVEELAAGDRT